MKPRILNLLLAVCLLCAQMLASAHAIEHALEDSNGLPPHICQICLLAHDLGTGIATPEFALAALAAASYPLPVYSVTGRVALPAPQPRQQAPPYA